MADRNAPTDQSLEHDSDAGTLLYLLPEVDSTLREVDGFLNVFIRTGTRTDVAGVMISCWEELFRLMCRAQGWSPVSDQPIPLSLILITAHEYGMAAISRLKLREFNTTFINFFYREAIRFAEDQHALVESAEWPEL